ncbi:unnamed protein product [Urochloa decumbens]|uniref:Uncharacterized protein n=1 Tax=Urochloa decumbens TaxID=240449 RepID=A0ABC9AFC0_9POAL
MPSPPLSPRPVGDPSRRPQREICVVPCTTELNLEEEHLVLHALVAVVGGTWPAVSAAQVGRFLKEYYVLLPDDYAVFRYDPEDFLVDFTNAAAANRVLHSSPPAEAPFQLLWKRWRRQSMASFARLRYRVLVELKGVPAHAPRISSAQIALGFACSGLIEAPPELAGDSKRSFFVAAWCIHPDLIPVEKLMYIPEPVHHFDGGNLFLRPEEIVHSGEDGLWYLVKILVWEIKDWLDESSGSSFEDEDFPRFRHRHRRGPWPRTTRFEGDDDDAPGSGGRGISLGPG